MIVALSISDLARAGNVGVLRHAHSITRGLRDKHGASSNGWQLHIEGACGELCAAIALSLPWGEDVNTFKAPDLPVGIQVRTRSRPDYDLIIRRDDDLTQAYVLVTGSAPRYEVVGWAMGYDVAQDRYLRSYGGREEAWFVPRSELRPIMDLRARIHGDFRNGSLGTGLPGDNRGSLRESRRTS